MSVTAKQLSKSGARGKELDIVVREHLQILDDKLLKVERRWGRNVVTYDLPIILPLPGLSRDDAQRIVYSSIMRNLDKRGFETRILLDTGRTTIYIAWNADLDEAEVEAMNYLIRTKRIYHDDIKTFSQRVDRTTPKPTKTSNKPSKKAIRTASGATSSD